HQCCPSEPRSGNFESSGGGREELQGAAGMGDVDATTEWAWWDGARPLGKLSVAADQAHPRASARRCSLSLALSHGPWRSYIGRRGGPGGVLSDARGRPRRQWRVFRQREVAGSQSVPMNAQMECANG